MKNFGRKIQLKVSNMTITNDEMEIRFESPFDDDSKPNETVVEIYNLSKSTIAKIQKGAVASLLAGYTGDIGVLTSGKVRKILTRSEGVDKITAVHILDGEDFWGAKVTPKNADPAERYTTGKKKGQSKKQAMKISFKAGTTGETIIKRLVSILGLKLDSPIKLVKNLVYKKGYVVTGIIVNNLEEVVRDCGSVMYHRRGRLVIRPLKVGTDEKFILEENTGLLQNPDPFDDEGIKGFTCKTLLQFRITTASIITIKSKTVNGSYRAKKGKHICDENNFYSQFEVI